MMKAHRRSGSIPTASSASAPSTTSASRPSRIPTTDAEPTRRLNVTVADELARERSGLQMINPAPYNAEAPPEALDGEITPTDLHYIRSNFAVPEHDGTLTVGGAVENPMSLTLDSLRSLPAHERAVTLECAGNGRLEMRPLPTGEPWGDYAVSTARWKGVFLHEVLKQAKPAAGAVDVLFQGAD